VGKIVQRRGVETGDRSVFEVSSIKEVSSKPATASFDVTGSEWLLEDLGGSGVIDSVQATLTFPEARKVSGNGSCHRFFGPADVGGDAIKLGPLGTTRTACPEPVMKQESNYLSALQAAERFELKEPYLLLYCKGFEKPLRFTRK
jgi:heat shock protein HslJ